MTIIWIPLWDPLTLVGVATGLQLVNYIAVPMIKSYK